MSDLPDNNNPWFCRDKNYFASYLSSKDAFKVRYKK